MAEKRERCRAKQAQLTEKLDAKIPGSEVTGTRVNELENLSAFYTVFAAILGELSDTLTQPWEVVDETRLSGSGDELTAATKQYAQFRLLTSFGVAVNYSQLLQTTAQVIADWRACELDDTVIASMAGDALPNGRKSLVSEVLALVKINPESATALQKAGLASFAADSLVKSATAALNSPAIDSIHTPSSITSFKKQLGKILADVPAGHPAHALLADKISPAADLCECLHTVIAVHKEVSDSVGDMINEIVGPEAAEVFNAAEGKLKELSTKFSQPLDTMLGDRSTADALRVDIELVGSNIERQCQEVRVEVPQLGVCATGEIVRYLASGVASNLVVVEHYFAILAPSWRTVVIDAGSIVAIISADGEQLDLVNHVPADQPFSRAFPQLLASASHAIESLTSTAFELAHDICLGKVRFSPATVAQFPSQVAVRFIVFLWTELVEGSIISANRPAPRRPRTAAEGFRHLGAGNRSPRRPISATSHVSRINSPRKSISADPRPGSASSALFKKGKLSGNQSNPTSQRVGDTYSPSRPGTSDSVRRRRAGSMKVPTTTASTVQSRDAPLPRDQSTIATNTHLVVLLNGYIQDLQAYLLSSSHSIHITASLRVLLAWLYRCVRAWEEGISIVPAPDDYRWVREVRLYRKNGIFRLEQGSHTAPLQHYFSSMPTGFALTEAQLGVWGHIYSVDRLNMSSLLAGGCDASIDALCCLAGETVNKVSSDTGMRLVPTARNIVRNADILPDVVQIALSERLVESSSTVLITTSEVERVHPTLQSLPAPFVLIDGNVGFQVEAELAANGCETAKALAKTLMKLAELSRFVAKWTIPLAYFRVAATSMTAMLRQGQSSEAALYEVITQVVVPRAPAAVVPLLNTVVDTLFSKRESTLKFPQMTQAIQRACTANSLHWSIPLDQIVIRLALHLADPHTSVVVVRGHDSCGKKSLVTTCLESQKARSGKSYIVLPDHSTFEEIEKQLLSNKHVILRCASVDGLLPRLPTSGGGKLILLVDGELEEAVASIAGVSVMFVDMDRLELSSLMLEGLLAKYGSKCDGNTLSALFHSNLKEVVALGSGLTGQSKGRVLRTMHALLKGQLGDATSLNPQGTARVFWFAATWACAYDRHSDWVDFTSTRIPSDIMPSSGIFNAFVGADGDWANWGALPALSHPLQHVGTKRAMYLCRYLYKEGINVALVSSAGASTLQGEPNCAVVTAKEANTYVGDAMLIVTSDSTLSSCRVLCISPEQAHSMTGYSLVQLDLTVSPQCCSFIQHVALRGPLMRVSTSPIATTVCTHPAVSALLHLANAMPSVSPSDANVLCMLTMGPLCNDAELEILKGAVLSATQVPFNMTSTIVAQPMSIDTAASVSTAVEEMLGYIPTDSEVRAFQTAMAYLTLPIPHFLLHTKTNGSYTRSLGVVDAVATAMRLTKVEVTSLADLEVAPQQGSLLHILLGGEDVHAAAQLLAFNPSPAIVDTKISKHKEEDAELWARWMPVLDLQATIADMESLAVEAGVESLECLAAVHTAASSFDLSPDEVRFGMHLYGSVAAEVSTGDERRVQQLVAFLKQCKSAEVAASRRPVAIEGVDEYDVPDKCNVVGYSGLVNFTDYPAGPIRLAMHIGDGLEGAIKECHFASVSLQMPSQHIVQLTNSCSGGCRSRVEAGGKQVVINAATIELRLERCEGGWCGSVVDTSKGSPVVVGDVILTQETESPTVEWIVSRDEEEDTTLPTFEELEISEEEYERLLPAAATSARGLAKVADSALKALCRKSRTAADISLAVSLLPTLAAASYDERPTISDQCSEAYVLSSGRALVDILSVDTFAQATGLRPKQLRAYLATQLARGLPQGQFAEQAALFVKLCEVKSEPFVLYDPIGVLAPWATTLAEGAVYTHSLDGGVRNKGLLINCSLSPAGLSTILSSSPTVDAEGLAAAARLDEAALSKLHSLLDRFGGTEEALLRYLLSEEAQGDVTTIDALDSPSEPTVAPIVPKSKKSAPKEDPIGRIAVLILEAHRLLPKVRTIYRRSFKDLCALGVASLKAATKGGQGQIEASTKAFGTDLMVSILQQDKLMVCVSLSMAVLFSEGGATPTHFADAMRGLRCATPEGILEMDLELREEAAEAYEQWTTKMADLKSKKKEKKEFEDFLSPRAVPDYPFMGPLCWSNVLALTDSVPSLSGLALALQHGEMGKGSPKQDRWADWLATCIGPLPTYEKSTEVGPLEKLLVILALRPSKLVVGLLQFVVECLGSEFPDPYALVDPAQSVLGRFKEGHNALVIASPNLASFEAVQQLVGLAAFTASTDKDFKDRPAPRVCVEHASYEKAVLEVLEAVIDNNDWMLVQGWEAAPLATQRRILDRIHSIPTGTFKGLILLGSRCEEGQARPTPLIELPVVAANFVWSLRSTMYQHYATMEGDMKKLPPNVTHKLVFIASFLVSAIEQRSRFNTLGFANPTAFHRLERDAVTAVSSILALSKKKLPWDAVRQTLMNTIGGLSTVQSDRAVVQAYVDWLVHPHVVGDRGVEADGEILMPEDATMASHVSAIQSLPESDSTEMIGLHSGVEQRQREAEAERIFEFVEQAFVAHSSDRAAAVAKELLEIIPVWNRADTPDAFIGPKGNALDYVLTKEIEQLNTIVDLARSDLKRAQRRCRAAPIVGTAIGDLSESKVPASWQALTEPISRLQEWCTYIHNRHHQLVLWAQQGIPKLVLASTLANPRAVVGGLIHDVCRARNERLETAVPRLQLVQGATENSFDPASLPPYQVCFTGLRLVGAQFDKRGAIMELFGDSVDWWMEPTNDSALITLSIEDSSKTAPVVVAASATPTPVRPSTAFTGISQPNSTLPSPRTRPVSAATSRPGTAYNRSKSRIGALDLEGASLRTSLFRRPSGSSKYNTFHAPVYMNARRQPESCLGEVAIPSLEDENFWMLRGAMLVAN